MHTHILVLGGLLAAVLLGTACESRLVSPTAPSIVGAPSPVSGADPAAVSTGFGSRTATFETDDSAEDETNQGDTVETDDAHEGKKVEIEGLISELDATAGTLNVDGTMVSVTPKTVIRHGSTEMQLADLNIGDRVHVKGAHDADGVQALEILVQNQHGRHGSSTQVEGHIGGLSGTCPHLTFVVKGTHIVTNGLTTFTGITCETLRNGARVEVTGTRQANGALLATEVETEGNDEEDEDEEEEEEDAEVEVEGTVDTVSSGCPDPTFAVNSKTIRTNGATHFKKGTCGDIKPGAKVEVEGTRQPDSSVLAAQVEVERKDESTEKDKDKDTDKGNDKDKGKDKDSDKSAEKDKDKKDNDKKNDDKKKK